MAKCKVSTGSVAASGQPASAPSPQAKATMLFDGLSGSTRSRIVPLNPGQQMVLVAYDLAVGNTISVSRILRASYAMPTSESNCRPCDPGMDVPQSAAMNQVKVRIGATDWVMNTDNVMAVISVPGDYQFELSDEEMVGNVMLEMRIIDTPIDVTPVHLGWRS